MFRQKPRDGHIVTLRDGASIKALTSDLVRYFGVSVVALAVDYGLLIALHRGVGLHYLAAASLSFIAGLGVAWSLSVLLIFRGRRRLSAWREFVGFVLTGIAGLVLTQLLMVALVGRLGMQAEFAKIPIAGVVFSFNFLSRRMLLFTAQASPGTISAATAE